MRDPGLKVDRPRMARDLRFLVTALKVNNELEHIGDLAESIARKAFTIPKSKVDHSKIEPNTFQLLAMAAFNRLPAF